MISEIHNTIIYSIYQQSYMESLVDSFQDFSFRIFHDQHDECNAVLLPPSMASFMKARQHNQFSTTLCLSEHYTMANLTNNASTLTTSLVRGHTHSKRFRSSLHEFQLSVMEGVFLFPLLHECDENLIFNQKATD